MKTLTHFTASVVAAILLAACHRDPPAGRLGGTSEITTELQRSLEAERESRRVTEQRLADQEKAKSSWQTAALLAISAAIALLVIGTVLGTRAKNETRQKTQSQEI